MADATSGVISKIKLPNGNTYDINALTTNGHSVNVDVPSDAKFTDTQRSKTDIVDMIYPVGSIYISVNSTDPGTLFGGMWKRLPKGKFLYNSGLNSGTMFDGNGSGTETNGHVLTTDEMPKHMHNVRIYDITSTGSGTPQMVSNDDFASLTKATYFSNLNANLSTWHSTDTISNIAQNGIGDKMGITDRSGNSAAHSHSIPYISVFMWQRTA